MLNNPKGKAELEAIKALGFPLLFKGYDITAGIRLFEANRIQQADVGKYGLQVVPAPHGHKAPLSPSLLLSVFVSVCLSVFWCMRHLSVRVERWGPASVRRLSGKSTASGAHQCAASQDVLP